jgi:CheY-like chemotaxis protein
MKQQHRPITTEIFSDSPDVLIVEDDPDVAAGMMDLITDAGMQPFHAPDGKQALAHAEAWPPRIVLLDLRMPVLDGWGFLERWRVHPGLGSVPVVVVSSEPEDQTILQSVQGWVSKPVDGEELLRLVGWLLCDHRGEGAIRRAAMKRR